MPVLVRCHATNKQPSGLRWGPAGGIVGALLFSFFILCVQFIDTWECSGLLYCGMLLTAYKFILIFLPSFSPFLVRSGEKFPWLLLPDFICRKLRQKLITSAALKIGGPLISFFPTFPFFPISVGYSFKYCGVSGVLRGIQVGVNMQERKREMIWFRCSLLLKQPRRRAKRKDLHKAESVSILRR